MVKPWNKIRQLVDYTIDSTSDGYFIWIGIVSLCSLYNMVAIPARSTFVEIQGNLKYIWIWFDYIIDGLNIIDIFIASRTGFLNQGLMVTDKKMLFKNYASKYTFILDFVSIFPLEAFSFIKYGGSLDNTWFRINRLFKAHRSYEFYQKAETRTNYPNLFRVASIVLLLMVLIHWNTCVYFLVSLSTGLGSNSWSYPPIQGKRAPHFTAVNFTEPWTEITSMYIYSFYWSTVILAVIADVPHPTYDTLNILMTLESLAGFVVFASIVGNVGSVIENISETRRVFQEKMDCVKRYLVFRNVNKRLRNKVIKWFDYMWNDNKLLNEENAISTLSDITKDNTIFLMQLNTLKNIPLFKDCEVGLLIQLVKKLKHQTFCPGDYIYKKGEVGREMYIVRKGKVNVVGDDGIKVLFTLSENGVFGELSLLNIAGSKNCNRRTANVRSIGYSELLCLNKDDFSTVLMDYENAQKLICNNGKEILLHDNMLDLEQNMEAQKMENLDIVVEKLSQDIVVLDGKISDLVSDFVKKQNFIKAKVATIEEKLFGQFM